MKIRVLKLLTLLLAAALLFSGCAGPTEDAPRVNPFTTPTYEWGKVTGKTITLWGDATELTRLYLTRAFERYHELTGNTIKTRALSKQEVATLAPQAFQLGSAERPDLMLSYGGSSLDGFAPDENFYDFTDAQWVSDLTDTAVNATVYNGKVMGLPCGEASISGLLYNKEVFSRHKLKIPTTQTEFMSTCKKLLEKGITPLYLPFAEITMLLYQFPLDSVVADTSVLDALNNGTESYATLPEMTTILNWYKSMADEGYLGGDYQKNDWNGMSAAMSEGKYAMMPCWDTWLYTDYTGDPAKIGLMPAFMGVPDAGSFEGPNILMMLANKKSANLDAVLDFLNFVADPYNYNITYMGICTAPIFNRQTGSSATPQYVENERLIERLFFDSTSWLRIRGFSQIDATYIQDYMVGKISLEKALRGMDEARLKRAAAARRLE